MKCSKGLRVGFVIVSILHLFGFTVAMAAPRSPLPTLPELSEALCKERFDEPCRGGFTNAQVSFSGYTFVESWSGYALQRPDSNVAPFVLSALSAAGRTNLACDSGSLSFWFKPYWTSTSLASGAGPGVNARLVELVVLVGDESAFVWSLQSSADGSTLSLMSPDGTGANTLLEAQIEWRAGEWRLVTLNYGPAGTELFVDGQRAAEGAGVLAVPPSVANLLLGTTLDGTEPAEGEFEEFHAFDRARAEVEVAAYYNKRKHRAALGPITPEEEQAIAEGWWVDPLTPDDAEQEDGGQFPFGAAAYGCGLWLEITASNAVATLTLNNTRSGAGCQILTNADLTTTNWSLFLTNVANGSGYLTWTNIAINLSKNLFFRACEARDYVTNLVFLGLNYTNVGTVPDSMGAVGPNHFVELLNRMITVYDKTGQLIEQANTTNFFAIGTNYPGGTMFDPRILYDLQAQRWVACAIDLSSYQVRLAVSKSDNPTNLATGWDRYLILEKPSGLDNDFTTLGLDSNGIYVRVLHRGSSTNAGHTVVAIKKPEIYQSQPVTNFVYRDITNDVPVWTIQPAVNFDSIPTNGYAWFIAKGPPDLGTNYQGGEILYRRLQWVGTNVVWADTNWVAVSSAGTNYRNYYDLDGTNDATLPSGGVVAQASGGNIDLYKVGSRLTMSLIRDGFLWTCHAVGLNGTNGTYSGDKFGANIDRSAVQWLRFQIGPEESTLTLDTHGRIFDSVHPTNAWWYHYPSLMVNCVGDMVAGFSGSSVTNYIGAYFTCRLANGYTPGQPRSIHPGTTTFTDDEWGDYSAMALDPNDDWSFWTVQEFATSLGLLYPHKWGTAIAKTRPSP